VRGLCMYARWKSRVWEKHAKEVYAHVSQGAPLPA